MCHCSCGHIVQYFPFLGLFRHYIHLMVRHCTVCRFICIFDVCCIYHVPDAQRTSRKSIILQTILVLISGWYANCTLHFESGDGFRCFITLVLSLSHSVILYDQIKLIKSITSVQWIIGLCHGCCVPFLSILWGQYDRLIRNEAYKIHMRTKCGKKLTHIAVRHALSYVCER